MKKYAVMMCVMLLASVSAFAVEPELVNNVAEEMVSSSSEFVIDLGTFTGIVACISALVTQLFKVVPAIKESKLAKIGISCAMGVIVCLVAWLLQLTPLLVGYEWWGVLIYGVAAGLSGCGFYDVIKAIGDLFKKDEELIY